MQRWSCTKEEMKRKGKMIERKRRSIRKDKRAFTGLEAAIVLTAFVVVAAVFSYVVLNAGFFTTQKSKQVVHAGVEQATSSVELAGNVMAHSINESAPGRLGTNMTNITVFLALTAGGSPADLQTLRLTFTNPRGHWGKLLYEHETTGDNDQLLEFGEIARLYVNFNATADLSQETMPNELFTLEIKPPQGSTITVERRVPAAVDVNMDLK
ncbi:MAG: archaellin/type IV pilin N-terminal domain-containing protein [Halobacteriota archaeon]